MEQNEIRDFTKIELLKILLQNKENFSKAMFRTGDLSTSVYFFNTKNSVNAYVNIDNNLLADYKIDLKDLLTDAILL